MRIFLTFLIFTFGYVIYRFSRLFVATQMYGLEKDQQKKDGHMIVASFHLGAFKVSVKLFLVALLSLLINLFFI